MVAERQSTSEPSPQTPSASNGDGNGNEVFAAVSQRSRGGTSLFEAGTSITSANVRDFQSEDEDIRAAVRELQQLGFRVLQVSPTTISIAGSRRLFTEAFSAQLRVEQVEIMAGQEIEYYRSVEPVLQAPERLRSLIEGIALAEPVVFYESAIPPIALPDPSAYHYLRVPDDVALTLRASLVHQLLGSTGEGVEVAMPDSGFYYHPFYALHGYRSVRGSIILGPGASDPSQDLLGHGTGEAANVYATAPGATLLPVKIGPDVVGAFNYAVTRGPQVITNSWGLTFEIDAPPSCPLSPYGAALAAAISTAVADGIIVCFSAGNGPPPRFPASHPDVISAGGVHVNAPVNYPSLGLEASNYASSFDSCMYPGRHVPDLCGLVGREVLDPPAPRNAPLIMLPVQPGSTLDYANTGAINDGWGIFSGTSAACPQVAGVAALLLQKDPTLTPADVKTILMDSATDVTTGVSAMSDPAGPGPDAATGAGLVNAKYAWVITMGSVASKFFAASPEKQAEMLANRQMPRLTKELMAEIIGVLRI